jgi:hypothetical protein
MSESIFTTRKKKYQFYFASLGITRKVIKNIKIRNKSGKKVQPSIFINIF